MNTLRAFQGIATAFNVTLAPDTVDFFLAPDLVGEIHRGDGNVALATVTPTWINTDNDALAVPLPAATSAALEAGHYFLTVKAADGTATLSHDTLVIYPTPDGDVPIRSLVTPSEMIGVIPEITPDLGQLDALPWLLEAATVACESYLGRALYPTTIDAVDYSFLTDSGTIHLGHWPAGRRPPLTGRGRPATWWRSAGRARSGRGRAPNCTCSKTTWTATWCAPMGRWT
jgi:hypothetical protein